MQLVAVVALERSAGRPAGSSDGIGATWLGAAKWAFGAAPDGDHLKSGPRETLAASCGRQLPSWAPTGSEIRWHRPRPARGPSIFVPIPQVAASNRARPSRRSSSWRHSN